MPATVEALLRAPRPRPRRARPARIDGAPLDPINAYGHDVLWWLDRAVRARHPLVERMTFNWHDHFATSNDGVGDTRLMLKPVLDAAAAARSASSATWPARSPATARCSSG